jgi:hypothetical protein
MRNEGATVEQTDVKFKWEEDYYKCRGNIFNALIDPLFDMYAPKKYAKEIWEVLDNKYKTGDFENKSYPVSNYFDFKMVDNKPRIRFMGFNLLSNNLILRAFLLMKNFKWVLLLPSFHQLGRTTIVIEKES